MRTDGPPKSTFSHYNRVLNKYILSVSIYPNSDFVLGLKLILSILQYVSFNI